MIFQILLSIPKLKFESMMYIHWKLRIKISLLMMEFLSVSMMCIIQILLFRCSSLMLKFQFLKMKCNHKMLIYIWRIYIYKLFNFFKSKTPISNDELNIKNQKLFYLFCILRNFAIVCNSEFVGISIFSTN